MNKFSICIYCGSRPGTNASFAETAHEVGSQIGQRGWGLVYGGGRAGLMGVVADAALAAGAPVVGVIPQSLMDREVGHPGLTELHVVETMHQRKHMMAERCDAFLALPGGIGTFEELFEVWSWRQLGYHDKPIGLLNAGGYYDPLIEFLSSAGQQGFIAPSQLDLLQVGASPSELLERLERLADSNPRADDYRRI